MWKQLWWLSFYRCSSLKNITIPNSVTSIGNDAFRSCIELALVIIGEGMKTFGNYAFSLCSSLKNITIPSSVTSIGDYAFYECSELETVIIGESVETIGNYSCSSLECIYFYGKKSPKVASSAFSGVQQHLLWRLQHIKMKHLEIKALPKEQQFTMYSTNTHIHWIEYIFK